MDRPFSIYLDVVRFAAAFVVLLSHFAFAHFTNGDYSALRDYNLGSDAVVVFFVLSGFVIAYTTEAKRGGPDGNLAGYLSARLARLYSVALPAVVLTLVLDHLGAALTDEAWQDWWKYQDRPVWRALVSLVFANEIWGAGVSLGSNGPYWSVSYEFWYYLLFATAVFLRGWRRFLWMGLIGLIAGPQLLALLPAWLLGVVAWRLISRSSPVVGRPAAWMLAVAAPLLYVACLAARVPDLLMGMSVDAFGSVFVREVMRFSDEFLWNNMLAGLVFGHFIGMATLMRGRAGPSARVERLLRWPAAYTFSLYLFHYPLLKFVMAVFSLSKFSTTDHAILLVCTLAGCFVLGAFTERRKGLYDRFFRWFFGRLSRPRRRVEPATAAGT